MIDQNLEVDKLGKSEFLGKLLSTDSAELYLLNTEVSPSCRQRRAENGRLGSLMARIVGLHCWLALLASGRYGKVIPQRSKARELQLPNYVDNFRQECSLWVNSLGLEATEGAKGAGMDGKVGERTQLGAEDRLGEMMEM